MNYSFLPDLLALAILIAILLLLRRRHPQGRADIWLLGLFFTLVEAVAHTFYPPDRLPPRMLHLIVMDCYLAAGMVFTWASGGYPFTRNVELTYLLLNTLPLLALTTQREGDDEGLEAPQRRNYLTLVKVDSVARELLAPVCTSKRASPFSSIKHRRRRHDAGQQARMARFLQHPPSRMGHCLQCGSGSGNSDEVDVCRHCARNFTRSCSA